MRGHFYGALAFLAFLVLAIGLHMVKLLLIKAVFPL